MRVRSWLIRGLILAGVAALAALAWLANSWISPERVREQVVLTLAEPPSSVVVTDFLEEANPKIPDLPIEVRDREVRGELRPFQIATLRIGR